MHSLNILSSCVLLSPIIDPSVNPLCRFSCHLVCTLRVMLSGSARKLRRFSCAISESLKQMIESANKEDLRDECDVRESAPLFSLVSRFTSFWSRPLVDGTSHKQSKGSSSRPSFVTNPSTFKDTSRQRKNVKPCSMNLRRRRRSLGWGSTTWRKEPHLQRCWRYV